MEEEEEEDGEPRKSMSLQKPKKISNEIYFIHSTKRSLSISSLRTQYRFIIVKYITH